MFVATDFAFPAVVVFVFEVLIGSDNTSEGAFVDNDIPGG